MKKIYTLIAGLLFVGTASAQLVNGNFEAPITAFNAALPGVSQTTGWDLGVYSGTTTSPGEGTQSVVLETLNSPTLNAAVGFGSDTISGQISQTMDGLVTNAASTSVRFMYKYAPVNSDTGVFVIEIYDTLLAGASDDVLLYQGVSAFIAPTATWTTRTTTVQAIAGATGVANQMFILAGSSIGGIFSNFAPGTPGSKLYIDDFVLNPSTASVEENKLTESMVYPNPTTDKLNFQVSGTMATSISIFGLDGKLVLTQEANGYNGTVDVSGLNAGMYIYNIATTSGESVKSTFLKK